MIGDWLPQAKDCENFREYSFEVTGGKTEKRIAAAICSVSTGGYPPDFCIIEDSLYAIKADGYFVHRRSRCPGAESSYSLHVVVASDLLAGGQFSALGGKLGEFARRRRARKERPKADITIQENAHSSFRPFHRL